MRTRHFDRQPPHEKPPRPSGSEQVAGKRAAADAGERFGNESAVAVYCDNGSREVVAAQNLLLAGSKVLVKQPEKKAWVQMCSRCGKPRKGHICSAKR